MWHAYFERSLQGYLIRRAVEDGEVFRASDYEREALVAGLEAALAAGEIDERHPPVAIDWVPCIGWHSTPTLIHARTVLDVVVSRPGTPEDGAAPRMEWPLDVGISLSQGIESMGDPELTMMIRRSLCLETWLSVEDPDFVIDLPTFLGLTDWEGTGRDEGLTEDGRWYETRLYRAQIRVDLALAATAAMEGIPPAPGHYALITKSGLKIVTKDGKQIVTKQQVAG